MPNVTSLIHRLRERHAQLVHEEVECTVLNPAEIEAKLDGLCEALVQAEGRVRVQLIPQQDRLAQEQKAPGACTSLAITLYPLWAISRQRGNTIAGIQIWRSGNIQSPVEGSK